MEYEKRDITTVQAPGLIAHGVNCQNAMGSGVAKALFTKWPKVKSEYHKWGSMVLGEAQFVEVETELIIANCFTQDRYGRDGRRYANASAIACALGKAARYALEREMNEIHIPKIGCGLGGLDWDEDVVPVLQTVERVNSIIIVVCNV